MIGVEWREPKRKDQDMKCTLGDKSCDLCHDTGTRREQIVALAAIYIGGILLAFLAYRC